MNFTKIIDYIDGKFPAEARLIASKFVSACAAITLVASQIQTTGVTLTRQEEIILAIIAWIAHSPVVKA